MVRKNREPHSTQNTGPTPYNFPATFLRMPLKDQNSIIFAKHKRTKSVIQAVLLYNKQQTYHDHDIIYSPPLRQLTASSRTSGYTGKSFHTSPRADKTIHQTLDLYRKITHIPTKQYLASPNTKKLKVLDEYKAAAFLTKVITETKIENDKEDNR